MIHDGSLPAVLAGVPGDTDATVDVGGVLEPAELVDPVEPLVEDPDEVLATGVGETIEGVDVAPEDEGVAAVPVVALEAEDDALLAVADAGLGPSLGPPL